MSNADQVSLAYLAEVEWGVDPGGARQAVRFTSESLGQDTETTKSAEIRSDRQTADVIRSGLSASGDVNFELSYGSFDAFLAAVLLDDDGDWSGNVIQNGTANLGTEVMSFTLEKAFTDIAATGAKYVGAMANTFSLEIPTNGIVTGTFGFLAKTEASVAPGTHNAVNSEQIMNSIDHVSSFKEGGGAANCVSWNMDLNNNLRQRLQVATLGAVSIGMGSLDLSGTYTRYFSSATLINKYLNFTASSFEVTLTDDDGNYYVIDIPEIKYTEGRRVAGGQNTDVIAELNWMAKRDPSSGYMIKITRYEA